MADLVSNGVDGLLLVVNVDLAPGCVTVPLAESVEVAEPLHTADVPRQQQVAEAVVRGAPHLRHRVQDNLQQNIVIVKTLPMVRLQL